MGFGGQVGLLLWKNLVLQRRKKCVTLFELSIPLVCSMIFFLLRFNVKITHTTEPTIYEDFPVNNNETVFNTTSMIFGDILLYSPNNSQPVIDIMAFVQSAMQDLGTTVRVQGFQSPVEMLDHYRFFPDNITYAIDFNVTSGATSLPTSLQYTLRPRQFISQNWRTDTATPIVLDSSPRQPSNNDPDYRLSGFLWIQRLINEAVIRDWNSSAASILDVLDLRLQRMPFPPYDTDGMVILLRVMFPAFLMLAFILMVIQTAKGLVYEKEKKLKESMKLMGLSAAAHWTSWFLTIFIYILIYSILFAIFCGVDMTGNGAVLAKTDPSLFCVFLLCYGMSIISFCFMLSVFTQKANIAAALTGIVYFGTYCPYFYFQNIYADMTGSQKLSSSLLFNVGMAFGAYVFASLEAAGLGAQWNNFYKTTSADNISLLDCMLMLLGDTCLYLLITWYVDNIWPGEFGVPKPWYFPFMRSYWCGTSQTKSDSTSINNSDDTHFEKEPHGLEAGISIRNLKKVFGSGAKKNVAVDGMSLNMYESQISVLLGHNGAGKTTTMSVLTGFLPSTGGTALVNGYDINTDIQSVRQSLGLCPQHNILFDTLTVKEHLEFFASLKCCSGREQRSEVEKYIQEIGLSSKRNTQSQYLSGGQKRKLSVGIALIGGSKIVILDEPTSGMDPSARRQAWDILQRNRQGRTLLLTTHFMDEADLLGDRIAIMAEGVVKCCGTSYFLKKLYGAGYHMVIVKLPSCQVRAVTEVVQRHIPTAQLESEINAEISYLLPDEKSASFPELFTEIEKCSQELGISSFGATATTMEEVFLRVESDSNKEPVNIVHSSSENEKGAFSNPMMDPTLDDNDLGPSNGVILDNVGSYGAISNGGKAELLAFNKGFKKATGLALELSRFRAIFIKKMLHTWRNITLAIVQLLLPVVFTIVALALTKISPGTPDDVALKLDLTPFHGTDVPYQNGTPPTQFTGDLANNYVQAFAGSQDTPEYADLDLYGNMSNYFIAKIRSMGVITFNEKVIIGGEYESDSTSRGHYNGQPYHSEPIALSFLMNGILKYFSSPTHSITTVNFPLPQNLSESSKSTQALGMGFGFGLTLNILFGMAFLTSSFVFFLIKERHVGAKHLQVISGVGPFVFWTANLAWDLINYIIPTICIVIVFAAFQVEAYTAEGRIGIIILGLVIYGWAVLPFMYTLQYLFKSPASGMVMVVILNIITGTISVMVVFVTTLLRLGLASEIIDWVFASLFPHHALGMIFLNMYTNYVNLDYCQKQNYQQQCATGPPLPCCKGHCGENCLDFAEDFLQWELPGVGRYVLLMAVQGLVYMIVILLIEYHVPQKIMYCLTKQSEDSNAIAAWGVESPAPEDSDVSAERQRISSIIPTQDSSDAIILKNLCKRFGNFVAVDHLNIGIPERECFGLLGQNGAGKTTTFRMMTGDVMVSSGNAYLWSYDVRNNIKKVQENMGYCPQFDALIDQMTGRETLAMYARLKGVPEDRIPDVCSQLLGTMMLTQYADKSCSDYSGGNKRKLSTAISLVGNPAFIMLDEPSTGMDPKARRQMWNILSKIRESGRTLILTSHSMEECDALCTKIAIMVNARFVCLGTPQHLKTKFGQGYTLIAKMAMLPDGQNTTPNQPLVDFIKSQYPETQVFDDHQGYVHFQVPYAAVSLAQVFTVMEQAKVQFSVEDYSVHQTTLEQVFLSFTRGQVPPTEPPPPSICRTIFCCCCCCCN